MEERPILFTPENAQKVFEGTKTQTRRIVKEDPPYLYVEPRYDERGAVVLSVDRDTGDYAEYWPYGAVGDRLWIREKHWRCELQGRGIGNGFLVYNDEWKNAMPNPIEERPYLGQKFGAIPSIHMPRWAARSVVELTEIRVERVQDISNDDAEAEGCARVDSSYAPDGACVGEGLDPYEVFAEQWDALYGEGVWNRNDWVWVLVFKKVPC